MLPDFPTVKKKIEDDFNKKIREKVSSAPFLSQIRRKRVHEGNILTSSSVEGYTERGEYKLISSGFLIKPDEIIEKGVEAFFSQIDKISEEFINQQSQVIFKKMDEVTERTGNIVNAKGKGIYPEIILEALEKVTIDFDEFGNPHFPALILNPKDWEKIKDKIPKWEADPNLRKKHLELVEKKRREWRDRESHRKLVD
jgi:hypothetical protein